MSRATSSPADYDRHVFCNVPFDDQYRRLFRALIFAVHDCGLVARCALEGDDGGTVRLEKIFRLIESCRFGIHDLSRTSLDPATRLPRFNMPLELGIFLGATRFGASAHRRKSCLILDWDRYRSQAFCSDIAGQDIRAHGNQVDQAISVTRNWLQANLPKSTPIPSPAAIIARYSQFRRDLPAICAAQRLTIQDLTFLDYRSAVDAWLQETRP